MTIKTGEAREGEAYAFVYCPDRLTLEKEVRDIRRTVGTPTSLELSVTDVNHENYDSPELRDIAIQARNAGMNCAVKGRERNSNNSQISGELGAFFNQAWNSPAYQGETRFRGEIYSLGKNGEYQTYDQSYENN